MVLPLYSSLHRGQIRVDAARWDMSSMNVLQQCS
jgi:hypothetical protein